MNKRIFFLIIVLVSLSGCTAQYNVEIKNNQIKENVNIKYSKNDDGSKKYFSTNKFYSIMDSSSNFKEYKKKIINKSGYQNVNFSYEYTISEYESAVPLKSCFKAYNVLNESKYYIFSTSKGLTCAKEENTLLLKGLDVIIKTNHVVKSSNADEVKGYKYIWHFNKENLEDKNLYIKMYQNKYVFNYDNEFTIKLLLSLGFIVIVVISVIIIFSKIKRANKV